MPVGFFFERYSYDESQNSFPYLLEHTILHPVKQVPLLISTGTGEHLGSSLMQVFAMASVTDGHVAKIKVDIYLYKLYI